MLLAIGSFHTSSDLLAQVLLDLCARPDWNTLVEELRQEIVSALHGTGWKKIALNDLKLLDSALKEAQRLKPASTGMIIWHILEFTTSNHSIYCL
jgi:cytochrome P450